MFNTLSQNPKNIKGVKFLNTPISESKIDYLSDITSKDKSICLGGYISCITVGEDSLTVSVEIAGGITVEAIYSTLAGENHQLHSFLEEFHCLFEDAVDFRNAYNWMAVDVWFQFNKESQEHYATKISTSPVHSTFSREISNEELERIMYEEYKKQENKRKEKDHETAI